MKKKFIIPISIIIGITLVGFIIAALLPASNIACTEMGCPCQGVDGERPCNSCHFFNPVFITGILNVKQKCRAREIITCKNDAQIDSRIDLENKKCTTNWYFLEFVTK